MGHACGELLSRRSKREDGNRSGLLYDSGVSPDGVGGSCDENPKTGRG